MNFWQNLLDTSDFPARWHCGRWTEGHGWLHILSDLGVWSAYFAIPGILLFFIVKRGDLPFRKVFILFVAFILFCGITHLMEAIIFWWPAYRLAGVLKLATATVSWLTVFALIRVAPIGLSMRSPEELEREISARKRTEQELQLLNQELRESKVRFIQLANAIPQLAWVASPDGYVEWYNNRWYEYTGMQLEAAGSDGWQSVIEPGALPEVNKRWQASLATGEPFDMVYSLRGVDGNYRPFLSRIVSLRDENGNIARWFGTNTDISEQKSIQEELRAVAARLSEADRRKDEFLATLAHELRNPLAPIRTGLEVLKLCQDEPATVEGLRNTLERQTQQLIMLVDDLLDVSRITSGKLQLRKCHVGLSDVIQSAVEAARPAIDEANHRLTLDIPEKVIHLHADPNRLAQIFSNLLTNAAKFTPEGGEIWLKAERQGNDVVVVVRDQGIGIPAEKMDRIFEMFGQIDHPLQRSSTGLGIGLALVKLLVEMHGGEIRARSEGLGHGSEFAVRLPALAEKPIVTAEALPTQEHTDDPSNRVLVVDDNEAAAQMLSMMVKILGNEVRIAKDGAEAIAVAEEFVPEVILMDIGMPQMNGYEAARYIRQQEWGKKIMLIALTGWGQDEHKRQSQEAGFDFHLVKPAEPAELENLLRLVNRPS